MAKKKRNLRKTHLVVCEGVADLTMIKAISNAFNARPKCKLKYESANGGSPYDILYYANKLMNNYDYDICTVFMDSDIPLCKKSNTLLATFDVDIIFSEPICLEGFLLEISGHRVPAGWTAKKCKTALEENYKEPYCYREQNYFAPLFKSQPRGNKTLELILKRICEL